MKTFQDVNGADQVKVKVKVEVKVEVKMEVKVEVKVEVEKSCGWNERYPR